MVESREMACFMTFHLLKGEWEKIIIKSPYPFPWKQQPKMYLKKFQPGTIYNKKGSIVLESGLLLSSGKYITASWQAFGSQDYFDAQGNWQVSWKGQEKENTVKCVFNSSTQTLQGGLNVQLVPEAE